MVPALHKLDSMDQEVVVEVAVLVVEKLQQIPKMLTLNLALLDRVQAQVPVLVLKLFTIQDGTVVLEQLSVVVVVAVVVVVKMHSSELVVAKPLVKVMVKALDHLAFMALLVAVVVVVTVAHLAVALVSEAHLVAVVVPVQVLLLSLHHTLVDTGTEHLFWVKLKIVFSLKKHISIKSVFEFKITTEI